MKESPTRSALVSIGFLAWALTVVIFTFAAADNALNPFPVFVTWCGSHWWCVIVSLVLNPAPLYRAMQAIQNSKTT